MFKFREGSRAMQLELESEKFKIQGKRLVITIGDQGRVLGENLKL